MNNISLKGFLFDWTVSLILCAISTRSSNCTLLFTFLYLSVSIMLRRGNWKTASKIALRLSYSFIYSCLRYSPQNLTTISRVFFLLAAKFHESVVEKPRSDQVVKVSEVSTKIKKKILNKNSRIVFVANYKFVSVLKNK